MSSRHRIRCFGCGRKHKDSHEKKVLLEVPYSDNCHEFRPDDLQRKMYGDPVRLSDIVLK